MLTCCDFNPLVVDVVVYDGLGIALGLADGASPNVLETGQAAMVLQTAEIGGDVLFTWAVARAGVRRGVWIDDGTAVGPAGDARPDIAGEMVVIESETHFV